MEGRGNGRKSTDLTLRSPQLRGWEWGWGGLTQSFDLPMLEGVGCQGMTSAYCPIGSFVSESGTDGKSN